MTTKSETVTLRGCAYTIVPENWRGNVRPYRAMVYRGTEANLAHYIGVTGGCKTEARAIKAAYALIEAAPAPREGTVSK